MKGVAVKFFLSVFSGLSSTVFSFIYQDNLLKRTMALWSPKRRENSISIQLGEKVELIAKTPELWSRHRSVMCGVFSLGTITWCGLRLTTTILDN